LTRGSLSSLYPAARAGASELVLKPQFDSKAYETGKGKRLAKLSTLNSEETLYQTPEGGFYLLITETFFKERKLAPFEDWRRLGVTRLPDDRLHDEQRRISLSPRQALEWCVRTQIPETFRGYLLECL
jgi:hypothetical protein